MAVISGKGGTVLEGANVVGEVTRWRLRQTSNNAAWASSSTGGFKNRVAGVKDWSGTLFLKRDPDDVVPLLVGGIYTLHLTEDGSHEYSGRAVVDTIEEDVDIDTGEAISLVVGFSGAGALTVPVA